MVMCLHFRLQRRHQGFQAERVVNPRRLDLDPATRGDMWRPATTVHQQIVTLVESSAQQSKGFCFVNVEPMILASFPHLLRQEVSDLKSKHAAEMSRERTLVQQSISSIAALGKDCDVSALGRMTTNVVGVAACPRSDSSELGKRRQVERHDRHYSEFTLKLTTDMGRKL